MKLGWSARVDMSESDYEDDQVSNSDDNMILESFSENFIQGCLVSEDD